jgi:peptide deformylase
LQIIHYPHPTLRHRSRPVRKVDRELRATVAEMFDLMYEARGIGLAANQVDLPLQLFVVNLAGERGAGEEMVFLNPVLSAPRGSSEREEGCLSIPGLHADVIRPESVHVTAWNLSGEVFDQRVDGMLARAIQHENDHLLGTLFIDRLAPTVLRPFEADLREMELELESQRVRALVPDDAAIRQRLAELELRYC